MEIIKHKIDDLKPFAKNPKKHPPGQLQMLKKSMQEFGWTNPILVAEDNMVVAGHARLQAAKELNFTEVPVIKLDLPYEKAVAYVIADNRLAELAETDNILIQELLSEVIDIPDFDLEATGYSMDDLNDLIASTMPPAEIVEDVPPEPPEDPVTVRGDIWELGRHRLMCGDSTVKDDVERLMGGHVADMCVTDPPWNVAIGLDSNPRHRQREGLQNDNLSADDFRSFIRGFAENMARVCKGDVYCVLGASEWPTLDSELRRAGYHWSATIIWAKDQFVLGRSKYHRRYEPMWYGWHEKNKSSYVGGRDQDDVWEFPRPKVSAEHPTMKPVELFAKAVANSSKPNGRVFEPFGGSGTTLLASEQLLRSCNCMELSEQYCDVIIQRYVNFTGNHDLTRNGEPYTWPESKT